VREGPVEVHLRQRRFAMRSVAGWVAANGPLRNDMSVDAAAAMLWTLASPEVHRMLTVHWHWSREQYQDWLQETLTAALLP